MKLIEGRLYIEFRELVECGVPETTISKAKMRGSNGWGFRNDPADARKLLIDYAELNEEYKKKVIGRYGNPYDAIARKPLLNMVIAQADAEVYYKQYRYTNVANEGEAKCLPIEVVYKCIRAAAWLQLLAGVNKELVKKQLGLGLKEFYGHVEQLVKVEKERGKHFDHKTLPTEVLPGDFPATYQRLLRKVDVWKERLANGGAEAAYGVLIDPMFGNKIASKMGKVSSIPAATGGDNPGLVPIAAPENAANVVVYDPKTANNTGGFDLNIYEQQKAVILHCSGLHTNLDAAQVAKMANIVFAAKGWKTVTGSTVRRYINENDHLLAAGRRGKSAYRSTKAMQVKRKAPDYPMLYWVVDGWTVELTYQERVMDSKGHWKTEYSRLVVVVVLDAYNKYPIGYAIGSQENTELIKQANRNALLHTRELLGEVWRPGQIQTDNYNKSGLQPFYQAMSHLHTPAAVGNAKAKVIEPYFMYLNKTYCQTQYNWSGFNVTAKQANSVNRDMVNLVKKDFPTKAGVMAQIHQMMAWERQEKGAQWLAQWEQAPKDERNKVSVQEWLEVFAVPIGGTNKCTGEGLVKTIGGEKHVYDSFDPGWRANMQINWQILADPTDTTRVLAVSPDQQLRYVLTEKRVLPMDVHSMTTEDHQYLARVMQTNRNAEAAVAAELGRVAETTREVVGSTWMNPTGADELALKLLLTVDGQQKNRLQAAKGLLPDPPPAKEAQIDMVAWNKQIEQRQNELVDFSAFK